MGKRQRSLLQMILGFGVVFVALLGTVLEGHGATIQITSGEIGAVETSDFMANGSLSGPGFSMSVSGNPAGCGPCASIEPPHVLFQNNLNSVVHLFGRVPPRPNLPAPTDFVYQGDPYAISGEAALSAITPTVPLTTNPLSTTFILSGTMVGQNLRTGTFVTFDVVGDGTTSAFFIGMPPVYSDVREISLAFQAIPEPSTWLLILSGLVTLIGAKAIRRQT